MTKLIFIISDMDVKVFNLVEEYKTQYLIIKNSDLPLSSVFDSLNKLEKYGFLHSQIQGRTKPYIQTTKGKYFFANYVVEP